MNIKEEIEKVLINLNNIQYDKPSIEIALGYRKNYINQCLSDGGNLKFLKALQNFYAEKTSPITVRQSLEDAINELKTDNVRLKASVGVLEELVDYLIHKESKESLPIVSRNRKKAVSMGVEHLLDQLRNQTK